MYLISTYVYFIMNVETFFCTLYLLCVLYLILPADVTPLLFSYNIFIILFCFVFLFQGLTFKKKKKEGKN